MRFDALNDEKAKGRDISLSGSTCVKIIVQTTQTYCILLYILCLGVFETLFGIAGSCLK